MSIKPLWYRWTRVFAFGGGIIATGVVLLKYLPPTDEELIAKFSPEVRAQYEQNKAFRMREQEELRKIAMKTAASNDPIWMTGPLQSPFEGAKASGLISKEAFEREVAEKLQMEELEKARSEALENEKLAQEASKQKKSSWW